MSYLNDIEKIISSNKWDYYKCHYKQTIRGILQAPNSFINTTFITAKKKDLVDDSTDAPNISAARAAHSISSYFLGFRLAEGLIEEHLEDFCAIKDTKLDFAYVWYLTSLYHDFGYCYERDKNFVNQMYLRVSKEGEKVLNNYFCSTLYHLKKCRQLSIDYSIWNVNRFHKGCDEEDTLEKSLDQEIKDYVKENYRKLVCNGNLVSMPMRSSRIVNCYLNYRLLSNNERRRIDHGVCGGLAFYDKLFKNYIKAYKRMKRDFPDLSLKMFFESDNGRVIKFSLDQLVVFMYVADCIINHNIWKAKPSEEQLYKDFGLKALIGENFEKINFYKNPLLFILALSDTLEPYKNFFAVKHSGKSIDDIKYSMEDVLSAFEDFDISISSDKIVIQVPDMLRAECQKTLTGMEDWIDIRVEKKDNFIINILR